MLLSIALKKSIVCVWSGSLKRYTTSFEIFCFNPSSEMVINQTYLWSTLSGFFHLKWVYGVKFGWNIYFLNLDRGNFPMAPETR